MATCTQAAAFDEFHLERESDFDRIGQCVAASIDTCDECVRGRRVEQERAGITDGADVAHAPAPSRAVSPPGWCVAKQARAWVTHLRASLQLAR